MKQKRLISKINTIIFAIIMALSLFILFNIFTAKLKGEQPRIFEYSFHIVLTDSMTPDINPGDFVIAKKTDKSNIQTGDYIVFVTPNPSLNGITIIHKVTNVNNDNGEITFNTSGIKEGATPDEYPVSEIVGKYVCKSQIIGKIIVFFSKIENILFLTLIITITVIIIKQIKKILDLKNDYEKD